MNKILFIFMMLSVSLTSFAQGKGDWTIEFSDDEQIEVWSRFSKSRDDSGNKLQIIEYKVTTVASISYDAAVALLRDINRHKNFLLDTEDSYRVSVVENDVWVIYYLIDTPWPMPDSDCVTQVTLTEKEGQFTFKGYAVPDKYEDRGVKRMKVNNIQYSLIKQADGKVKIEITSFFAPVMSAPEWLIKGWFPDGPIELIENFIEEVNEGS